MDLRTDYLGLSLPHPFMVGAGPLADTLDSVRAIEDAGAAAIGLRSLFEEQMDVEALATVFATETHADSYGEATSFFPEPSFSLGPEEYLDQIRRIKDRVAIPVIASLNGASPGGWLQYAREVEEAGADALELNIYHVATDPAESGESLEKRDLSMVREVSRSVKIPLAVKLSPSYTALPHFAAALGEAGAAGLVLFNRFFEPDIDLEELEFRPRLKLSESRELLLRLRWLGILSAMPVSGNGLSLAVSGGVHTDFDAIKAIMCGASAVQMVSAVLKGGAARLTLLRQEVSDWLEEREYESLQQMRGSMNAARCPDPAALSRANYMKMLLTWAPE